MYHSGYGGDDMFVMVTYDVHRTRCAKVMKYLRQWLEHRQRSVFMGFLTESQVRIMYDGLRELINVKYDSIIVIKANRANQVTEWTTKAAELMRAEGVTAHLNVDPLINKNKKKSIGIKKKFRFRAKKTKTSN